jgi:hypothetical protein
MWESAFVAILSEGRSPESKESEGRSPESKDLPRICFFRRHSERRAQP